MFPRFPALATLACEDASAAQNVFEGKSMIDVPKHKATSCFFRLVVAAAWLLLRPPGTFRRRTARPLQEWWREGKAPAQV
mmetsp:Transcript_49123/g.152061  ORF Transcript_49123/g.152061 Transcript_49123/m.152061 type:complete len:80 (-) Transcript_49123:399-638(-)